MLFDGAPGKVNRVVPNCRQNEPSGGGGGGGGGGLSSPLDGLRDTVRALSRQEQAPWWSASERTPFRTECRRLRLRFRRRRRGDGLVANSEFVVVVVYVGF